MGSSLPYIPPHQAIIAQEWPSVPLVPRTPHLPHFASNFEADLSRDSNGGAELRFL